MSIETLLMIVDEMVSRMRLDEGGGEGEDVQHFSTCDQVIEITD